MHLIIGTVIAGIIVLMCICIAIILLVVYIKVHGRREMKKESVCIYSNIHLEIYFHQDVPEKVVLFHFFRGWKTNSRALIDHYAVIINSTSDELEEITTNMTGVLDTADGPTILAHTDRMKLIEANILKKDNKRHSKGKEKMRKLQGSDKLPHQTSTANRLRLIREQGKEKKTTRKVNNITPQQEWPPPTKTRNHAHLGGTHSTPPTAHALATSQHATGTTLEPTALTATH